MPAPIAILIILDDLFRPFDRIPAIILSMPIIIRAISAKITIAYSPSGVALKDNDSNIIMPANEIQITPTAT
jgi:hypothetical protein